MYTLEDVKKLKQSIPTQTKQNIKASGQYTIEDVKRLKQNIPTQQVTQPKPISPEKAPFSLTNTTKQLQNITGKTATENYNDLEDAGQIRDSASFKEGVNSLLYSIPEKPAKALGKGLLNIESKMAKTTDAIMQDYIKNTPDYKMTPEYAKVQSVANRDNQKLIDTVNKNAYTDFRATNKDVRDAGNTVGYVASGSALTALGVPASVAFGITSGVNAYADTDDPTTIGTEIGKGAAFGLIDKGITKGTKGLLSKIAVTNPVVKGGINSALNMGANITKNAVSQYAGGFGASAITTTVGDLIKGNELDWQQIIGNANVAGLTNMALNTYGAVKGDINQAKIQLAEDVRKTAEEISKLQTQMQHPDASPQMLETLAKRNTTRIEESLKKLSTTQYLGQKKALAEAVGNIKAGNQINTMVRTQAPLGLAENNTVNNQEQLLALKNNTNQVAKNNVSSLLTPNLQTQLNTGITNNAVKGLEGQIKSVVDARNSIVVPKALIPKAPVTKSLKQIASDTTKNVYQISAKGDALDGQYIALMDDGTLTVTTDFNKALPVTTENNVLVKKLTDKIKRRTDLVKITPTTTGQQEANIIKQQLTTPTLRIGNQQKAIKDLRKDLLVKNNMQNLMTKQPNMLQTIKNSIPPELPPKVATQYKKEFPMQKNEPLQSPTIDLQKQVNDISLAKNSTIQPNNVQANKLPTYKQQMFNNNARAINSLIKQKNTALNEFNKKIKEKQDLLNSKKDKTTAIANLLRQQITSLIKQKTDIETGYTNRIDNLTSKNVVINDLKKQVSDSLLPTRQEVRNKIIEDTELDTYNFDALRTGTRLLPEQLSNNLTSIERVAEKTFLPETAKKINDNYIIPAKDNESDKMRFLEAERGDIKQLDIKDKSKEAAAVQMYGEREVVDVETGKSTPYTLKDLQKDFPQSWEKIKYASEVLRQKYDMYLDMVNKVLNENGYDSIPKRDDYFRHFEEMTDLFSKLGINTKSDLPTDINGITEGFIPGKNFFASALARTGNKTSYNAIKGIDGYLEGVSNLIYHTGDVQRIRTLEKYLRTKYGKTHGLDDAANMSDEQKTLRIQQIQDNHLSKYVTWLHEYGNILAGKTAKLDRAAEEAFGREVLGGLNVVKKQVGVGLTGYNINTPISNFMSLVQAAPRTNKIAFGRGLLDTINNMNKNDGLDKRSNFITRRVGSEPLSQEILSKVNDNSQLFMKGSDYFTANIIVRSKYYEYQQKGYGDDEALRLADNFADRLMGGRTITDMPLAFNSKTLGTFTQFKLEELNAIDSQFHDNFNTDYAKDSKSEWAKKDPKSYNKAVAIFTLGELWGLSYVFNNIKEAVTGYGGMFDPFGTVEDITKTLLNKELSDKEKQEKIVNLIVDQIPFMNYLTGGGRIPTVDALPDISGVAKGNKKLGTEALKLLNVIPGGGQIRKTSQGISTLLKGGDYYTNSEGKEVLRFPVDLKNMNLPQKIGTTTKAVLFGKNSLPTAKDWINNGFNTLTPAQTIRLKQALSQGYTAEQFMDALRKEKARNSLRRQK